MKIIQDSKGMSNPDDNTIYHGVPCSQSDNIGHLKSDVSEIKRDINTLYYSIDGNGKPGMKMDLAIVKKDLGEVKTSIGEINKKLSTVAEIDLELEVSRRVHTRLNEIKAKKDLEDDLKLKKGTFSWYKVMIIIALLGFLVTATFQVLNYHSVKEVVQTEGID